MARPTSSDPLISDESAAEIARASNGQRMVSSEQVNSNDDQVLSGFRVIRQAHMRIGGSDSEVTLAVSDQEVLIVTSVGQRLLLENPAGSNPSGSLMVVPANGAEHLLVKLYDGRIMFAWIVVPNGPELSVVFAAEADDDITVWDGQIKVGNRKYRLQGGYTVEAQLYRFDPNSQTYIPSN